MSEILKYRKIFLTGGTGFLGKILLRKLLDRHESIDKIYLLVRSRNNQPPQERLKKLLDNSLCFSQIKSLNKIIENKIELIEGDLDSADLSISNKNYDKLASNIDLVINAGASISWKEQIDKIINTNLIGTSLILDLAVKAKVKHFVHISTMSTYYPYKKLYNNKIYGENFDYNVFIDELNKMTKMELEEKSSEIHSLFGSTYAFAKSLCEKMIEEKFKNIPTTIIRAPSLGPCLYEPAPGWLDTITGYTGNYFYLGLGKALAYLVNKNSLVGELPVDLFADLVLLISAHREALFSNPDSILKTLNINSKNNLTVYESFQIAKEYFLQNPVISNTNKSIYDINQVKFFFDKTEYDDYINNFLTSGQTVNKKLLEKTISFNKMYLKANFYETFKIQFSDLDEILNIYNEKIKVQNENDKKFLNFNYKYDDYVRLSCQGIKDYYIK
jgi:fatty acyl-CoA reductase